MRTRNTYQPRRPQPKTNPAPPTREGQRKKEEFYKKFNVNGPKHSAPQTSQGAHQRNKFWEKFGPELDESPHTKATRPAPFQVKSQTKNTSKSSKPEPTRYEKALSACTTAEQAWSLFESKAPEVITYDSIPWPDKFIGVRLNILGITRRVTPSELKEIYKKLQLRWHPDRFIFKFNDRFSSQEKEKIIAKCNHVTHMIIEERGRQLKK